MREEGRERGREGETHILSKAHGRYGAKEKIWSTDETPDKTQNHGHQIVVFFEDIGLNLTQTQTKQVIADR